MKCRTVGDIFCSGIDKIASERKADTESDKNSSCVKTRNFTMCDNINKERRGWYAGFIGREKILIGLKISYYRRARHMTQIELADLLNVSSNYLSQVERGCKSLSLDKLLELAVILEVDEKEFLDFSKLPLVV